MAGGKKKTGVVFDGAQIKQLKETQKIVSEALKSMVRASYALASIFPLSDEEVEKCDIRNLTQWSAYKFYEKEFNCTLYFDQELFRNDEIMQQGKIVYEKENPKWALIEVRAMCTNLFMPKPLGLYPYRPTPDKLDSKCAIQFVAMNMETNILIESHWIYNGDYRQMKHCAQGGLIDCMVDMSSKPELRAAVTKSLDMIHHAKLTLLAKQRKVQRPQQ